MTSPGVLADLLGGIRARVANHLGAGSITPLGREILIGELLDVERRLRELAESAPSGDAREQLRVALDRLLAEGGTSCVVDRVLVEAVNARITADVAARKAADQEDRPHA